MLKFYPDSVLSVPCKDVQNFDYLPGILDEMHEIVKTTRALGLAAPQIGHSLNLFLLRSKDTIHEIINPIIISQEGEQYEVEACLSFKDICVKIKRPMQIHFHYKTRENEYKEAIVFGMEAVCFAHEFDHLSGITIINRINRQERKRILKELSKK